MKFANEIIKTWNNVDLDIDECYVLTAACYLHDIGMFTDKYISGFSSGLTSDDYDQIRDEHPAITAMSLNTLVGLLISMQEPDYTSAEKLCQEALSLAVDNRTKDTALNYLVRIYENGFKDYKSAHEYCEKRKRVASKIYEDRINKDLVRLKGLLP
ncbi:MAG: hypothetical protein L7F77_15195 [Candidatus Magnetominusculus sp. LBB02]|nr:hypothetical protein [Candidatus Magnetominusculus sp. LBB02]